MRTNVSISTSWWEVFLIIKILAYKLHDVNLLRNRIETLRPYISPIGIPYLEANGIIEMIGRIKIPPGCKITKIRSERRKITV